MLVAKLSEYGKKIQECFSEVDTEKVQQAAELLLATRKRGSTLYVIGNGGSAATASHMAIDFEKEAGMRVVSLTNVPNITAWANDVGYEVVFTEQLRRHLRPADVVIAITASGNSPNILHAVEFARQRGAKTIGFVGFGGGKLKDMVDVAITVSSRNYGVVEDFHLSLDHILSQHLKDKVDVQETGKPSAGWMGVDFDGTLVTSVTKQWDGPFGTPIAPMVERVKEWLAQGIGVRIFTARVSPKHKDGSWQDGAALDAMKKRIGDWCEEHLGQRLESTCEKDHSIIQLWDDKAVQVSRDTGKQVGHTAPRTPRVRSTEPPVRCRACGTFLVEGTCLLCKSWKKDDDGLNR